MSGQEQKNDTADVEISGPGGVAVPMRTLYYDLSPEREMHVVVSLDRMSVYVRHIPGERFAGLQREQMIGHLYGLGICYGILDSGVNLFVALQNSANPVEEYVQLARGEPPRKGEDGTVEFLVQPTSYEPRYDVADDGAIDYKQLNLIENCFAGQRVASVIPPGPGRPGKNVFGEELQPAPGKPVCIQPGPGIVVISIGREFTSELEGRLVFEKDVLSVNGVLEIVHDIDYSIGNVDFVGKVVVKGSLLDGFYINAKRGVELSGDMGAARITSDGDVKIVGGVKGKNAAIITCRNLTTHYIDDAMVEAMGDVTATKEIMNSSVQALGKIVVTSGAIIGGVVCGFRGVEADTLGSEMGVSTWVMSGLNWTEENKKAEIRAKVAEYLDRAQSSKVLLDPLFNDPEVTSRLGTDQKSMLSELIGELRDVRENLVELLEERAAIGGNRQEGMVDQINVRKIVYMGVQPRFSRVDGEVKDSVKGPLSITPDRVSDAISFGQFTELPKYEPPEDEEENVHNENDQTDEPAAGEESRTVEVDVSGA